MKAVFVHDHNFVHDKKNNIIYDGSGGAFDKHLWNRYLKIFDHLTVVGREVEKLPNNLVNSTAANVEFELFNFEITPKNFLFNDKIIVDKLTQVINSNDFAILRLPSRLGSLGVDICRKANKKYVLEIVGDPFEAFWYHGHWAGKFLAPFELYKLKSLVKKSNYNIYVTNSILQKRYPSKFNSIGISNVRLESLIDNERILEYYKIDHDKIKIGLIGSFHVKYKGHIEALKALKSLNLMGYNNVELNLVGTGDSNWVLKLAEELGVLKHIKIVGALKAGLNGIFPFLDDMHIYIHPSRTEGLPRVILEAMSRGRMCLGSNVGGTSELLAPEYIHEAGDWKKLTNQIFQLIKLSKNEKINIGQKNRLKASEYLEEALQTKRENFIRGIL